MFIVLSGVAGSAGDPWLLYLVLQLFKGGEFSHCFASSQVFPQLDKCGEWRDWELNITRLKPEVKRKDLQFFSIFSSFFQLR